MAGRASETNLSLDDPARVIKLAPMPQQEEVREPDDDWTGLNDPKTRRKLQNRLNQRLWRKRQKKNQLSPGSQNAIGRIVHDENSSSTGSNDLPPLSEAENPEGISTECKPDDTRGFDLVEPPEFSSFVCRTTPTEIQRYLACFEKWAHHNYLMGSPRVDLLLTLINFNVFRALFSNTFTLGFDLEWLLNGDAISPFNSVTSEDRVISMPESLRPTKLQRIVEHHPWIDLFPIPEMRDNILLAGTEFDDTEICMDVVEIGGKPREKIGLIVWGEPWDPMQWEASPEFFQRWGWVLRGCDTITKSTNYWRMQRGENPIQDPQIRSPIHEI